MLSSKFQLTAKWAIVGAVAGIGFAGLNQAIGQGKVPPRPKPPTVDGWQVKGDYEAQSWPGLKFSVTITNTFDQSRSLNATVKLVRQEFKGSPMSRVSRPSDFVKTDLESQPLTGMLAGSASKAFTIAFKTQADPDAAKPMTRITYLLMVDFQGKSLYAAAARPAVARNH